MKKTIKNFIDPKEQMTSHTKLEKYNEQFNGERSSAREKRSPPTDDDDDINVNIMDSDSGQQMTPQGKKKSKINSDILFYNKNRSVNQHPVQQQKTDYDNNNNQLEQPNISEQAITYAIESNPSPIKIECYPALDNREHAKKFVINLFKYIEKDFRKKSTDNQQPIGFHHWWTDSGGKTLYGITKDVNLYIYLCDLKHYPAQIDNIKIKPDPPRRLPPQHTVVIKFVQNELHKDDIKKELKDMFTSIFLVEDIMGTMRSNSRHIRVEFYQKDDYNKIVNDGKIGLQGQIFEVEEYLPPPKILICSKCNIPGHQKKICQSDTEICRRCGQNRNDGNKHDTCALKCQHCGGEHMATDYKCPKIIRFRQELINRLKCNRDRLPPHIKLFIPVDCRTNGDRNRILSSQNDMESRAAVQSKPPAINPWTTKKYPNKEVYNKNEIDQRIKTFDIELNEIKKNFESEREKIKIHYENQTQSIQQGWLMIQQQVQAQNQCITIMSTMIKDNITAMGQLMSTITKLIETVKPICTNELDKNKMEMIQMMINSTSTHIKNLNDSFISQERNLNLIMNKQSLVFATTLCSFEATVNG